MTFQSKIKRIIYKYNVIPHRSGLFLFHISRSFNLPYAMLTFNMDKMHAYGEKKELGQSI